MADYDPKMIEAVTKAMWDGALKALNLSEQEAVCVSGGDWSQYADDAKAALSALPLTTEALNAIWRGEAVVVPKVRTRAMMTATPFIEDSWPAMLAASPYAKKE